ncbi:uncharacterized protein LOC134825010 isoform X2 [Bolinopsis microptera]|uniref:uncharacterized protein LOC134825010 isoform X2 n=1 Tax=Bolinopsis microptera TaxID=2820187 RepID=UPI00307938F4
MMCDIFIRCYFLYLLGTASSASVKCTKSADKYWKCDEETGEQVCVDTRHDHNCSTCIKDHYPVEGSPDCKYCTETDWYTCSDKGERECKDSWYGVMCDEYCVETKRFSCLGTGAISVKPTLQEKSLTASPAKRATTECHVTWCVCRSLPCLCVIERLVP